VKTELTLCGKLERQQAISFQHSEDSNKRSVIGVQRSEIKQKLTSDY